MFKEIKISDAEYANNGTMMGWLSPSGGVRTWFFQSAGRTVKHKNAPIHSTEGIRSIPVSADIVFEIKAHGLDLPTMDYVSSIMESNYVFLIAKAFPLDKKPVSVENGDVKYGGAHKGYTFSGKYRIIRDHLLS